MNPARLAAPLALSVAAAAAFGDGSVDLQVRGNEKIDGTIRPADATEDFLVDAPKDAFVSVTLKRTGSAGPVPRFELLGVGGAVLTQGTAAPTGAKLKNYALPESGIFRVRVAGDGTLDGDYQVKIKLAPRREFLATSDVPLVPGGTADFSFAAPAFATADLSFAQWNSPMAPRMVSIDGPDGFHADLDGTGVTPARHALRGVLLGGAGDYVVKLRNDGAEPGMWSASARLEVRKIAKSSVDIRDSALTGAFSGDNTVFGRVVDLTGGLIDPADTGGPLDGASVSVPADAMTTPTVIALSSSDTFFVDDAQHAAGIALKLTPAGTQFAVPVTVTVPYDPQSFDDPVNELSVYIEDEATGALVPVERSLLVIDTVNARVSFPTSHFSRFQGTTPRPRPVQGTFLQIEFGGRPVQGGGGQLVFGFAAVSAFKGPRSGNGFRRDLERTFLAYGAKGIVFVKGGGVADAGTLQIEDDSRITMKSSTDGDVTFVRGRNPDVLIQPPGPGDLGASTSVLLRVAGAAPTRATLAGRWHATVFEFAAERDDADSVRLQTTGQILQLDIGLDLAVTVARSARRVASAADGGGWQFAFDKSPPADGTIRFTEGGLDLTMALGTSPLGPKVTLIPVLHGDALVGTSSGSAGASQAPTSAAMRIVVLVRASDAASPLSIVGDALTSSFGLGVSDGADGSQRLAFLGEDARARHLADRTISVKGSRITLALDATGNPTRVVDELPVSNTYTVTKDGGYFEKQPLASGAVVTRGGFYVVTRSLGPVFSLGFGVVGPPKD